MERNEYMRIWYRKNAEKVRAQVKRYREKNIEKIRAYDRARGFREYDPQKTFARNRARVLERQPCEVCGSSPADAHHDDYSKPLDVRWLCETHHGEAHRKVF